MPEWNLRCNKTLLYIGTLFITLIVGVHIVHLLSSHSNFTSSNSSIIRSNTYDFCINNVNDIVADAKVNPYKDIKSLGHDVSMHAKSQSWFMSKRVASCGFQKLSRFDAMNSLKGSWVVVAGDSQARNFFVSFLDQVLDTKRIRWVKEYVLRRRMLKRREDFRIVVDEMETKLEFVWATFEANLSSLVAEFKEKRQFPDVLIMGSGLWHMLHITNASDYGVGLRFLRNSIISMSNVSETIMGSPTTAKVSRMFWLGMPVLVNGMLPSEKKKKIMTDRMWHAYSEEVLQSKILRQSGDGPFVFLNLASLTWNCGAQCTKDGMHYDDAVYEDVAQIMLNGLLVESRL